MERRTVYQSELACLAGHLDAAQQAMLRAGKLVGQVESRNRNHPPSTERSVAEDWPGGLGFDRVLKTTARWEGGWSDHKADPGGKTQYGITKATYRRAVEEGVVQEKPGGVRGISPGDAERIYQQYYWHDVGLGEHRLPAGVDLSVFDTCVNQGPGRAITFLQKAAHRSGGGDISIDGVLGPETQDAVRAICRRGDRVALLQEFTVIRMLHWSGLSTMRHFGLGWFRRGIDVLVTSIRLEGV